MRANQTASMHTFSVPVSNTCILIGIKRYEESGKCRAPGFSRHHDSVLRQSWKIGVTLIYIKCRSPIEDKVGANESDRFKSGSTEKVKRFSRRAPDTVACRGRCSKKGEMSWVPNYKPTDTRIRE